MYVCACVYVYVCMCVCVYVCMYVYVCVYVCMFVCMLSSDYLSETLIRPKYLNKLGQLETIDFNKNFI